MDYSHDFSDRRAALDIDLTPEETKADGRVAVAALEQAAGYLWSLSSQGGVDDEGDMQQWQQEADKLLEVADRLTFEVCEDRPRS